ncbi:MAG: phage terminase large subunit [Patescibacteria group bacterium]|nr:phage terminase large subunit [Patescibacteria group bacterium]
MTPERAASELLRRMDAATSLIRFTEFTFPRYRTALIHRQIAEQLERVERGEIDRLMLLVPPRHGKSQLASRHFPAFYLGRHPERQFISASAAGPLAEDFGRDVRNIVASPEYRAIFDTTLAEDSQARGRWNTAQGGSYYAAGVNAAIMGRGAHVFMIDDPFGTMADARSETERRNVWNWYTGTVYNRLEDNGAIVLINHRMHEDDLTGKLLAQQAAGGDQWEVVELKPDLENGVALWPEKYPIEVLERIRRNTTAQDWSALYLQNPAPEEGDYFHADWLRPYEIIPPRATLKIYGASDYAVTEDGGDWTVHIVIGINPEWHIYVLDLWRGQTTPDKWIEVFCDLVEDWRPIGWAEETGQIKASVGPFLERRMRERKTYVARAQFPTRGDKAIRAQSIRGRMALDGLYVPIHAPWYPTFRAELLSFPNAKHDDQVDALGLIGQVLDRMHAGEKQKDKEKMRGMYEMTLDELWAKQPKKTTDARI